MADNTKYVARIPIVPDDFSNGNAETHKDHELVMDFENTDLYVKDGANDAYINITGSIKEAIKKIQDGSAVIHIVTEDTLPDVSLRPANHWYLVITKAEEKESGDIVSTSSYVYYGTVQSYYASQSYLLISQNTTSESTTLPFVLEDGYSACLYVPVSYSASFTDHNTGDIISYTIEDRVYAVNTLTGTFISYDVYVLDLYGSGEFLVDMELTGSDYFHITFDTNESSIEGLVLPETKTIRSGLVIGEIDDPTWTDPRWEFMGWSSSRLAFTEIDPESYIPEFDMTLFAWFEYNSDPNMLGYSVEEESEG